MANETDKNEPVAAAVESVEKPTASVQKKTKKSKPSTLKAAVDVVAATQELSEAEHLSNLSVDHPYVSVLYKRIRSHRKKLEKIKILEQAQASEGKVLNAQQRELMGTKSSLEKLVAELEMLREQFIGVYSQELEQKHEKEEISETVEPIEAHKDENPEVQTPTDYSDVFKLLKSLHMVNFHHSQGKKVPMVLDFFAKMLLGNTRPPAELSYEENLMESFEQAKKYLQESDKIFACDTTYSSLCALVDDLATSVTKEESEEAEVLKEEPLDVPIVPAEINLMPEISFFTDSQLESEHETDVNESSQVEAVQEQCDVSPSVSSDSGTDKKGSVCSPHKNSRRRWREKTVNNNTKVMSTGKPRRRAPRVNDENSGTVVPKRNQSKENRRVHVERSLAESPPTRLLAPHA